MTFRTRPDPVITVYQDRKCENPLCGKMYRPRRYWQRFCSSTCRLYCFIDRRFTAEQSLVPRDPTQQDQDKMLEDGRVGAQEQAKQHVAPQHKQDADIAEALQVIQPSGLRDLGYDPVTDPNRPAYPKREQEKQQAKPPTIDDLD